MSVQDAYDQLAPYYRAYASGRATYLDAIDRYIVAHASRGARMLDVGSGDGARAAELARTLRAARLVLCEPSARMAALCREQRADAVWELPAQSLPETNERFDIITCLWNVLGHLPDRAARVAAFSAMRRLLAPGGQIYCDVNNRHNARAYGKVRVMLRRLLDGVAPDDRRGDAAFEWRIGGSRIPAKGHLFTPREMRELLAAADLRLEEQLAVDYVTGAHSPLPWDGQLLFRASARTAAGGEYGK